jgi:hypothetical protein
MFQLQENETACMSLVFSCSFQCVRDSDDGPCNRCRSKGKNCGDSRLPRDDTNHRIPKRISVGCQTEPESEDLLRSANSARQAHSSAPAATMVPDFSAWGNSGELGDFLDTSVFGMDDGSFLSGNYLDGIDENVMLAEADISWAFHGNVTTTHQPQPSDA